MAKTGRGVDFDMGSGEASIVAGYIDGISTSIRTNKYIDGAVSYASETLGGIFEQEMDAAALANRHQFFHVYKYGDDWESRYENVGLPLYRLWKLVIAGKGANRTVGFGFLPETNPTPVHPELLEPGPTGKVANEGVHIFMWKAPVMEYGQEVLITPKLPGVKKIIFYDESTDSIAFSEGHNATPGAKVQGSFTSFFIAWWTSAAPVTFDSLVRPVLERDIITDKTLKKVAKQATRRRTKNLGISIMDERKGEAMAKKHMMDNAINYVRRARRRRQQLYGY